MNAQTAGLGRPRGLATRLLAGQSIVLLAGALTAALVATLLGPSIFHQHLLEAGHSENSPEMVHIEMAYRDASLISLGLGLLIALLSALGVTWFLSRRLRRPLGELTIAARELSRGHYAARVPDVGTGTELETLAGAFNVMAARLEGIEDTRRRMLADLAHELRTPITTLTAYHDGLHDGVVQLGADSQAALTEQTDRLARLAEDIDEVSTAEEGRLSLLPEAVAVSDLLWNAGEAVRDRYRDAGVNLAVDTDGAAGLTVTVDRQRLGQVLSNLLTNALRHTPAGGIVTVSARQVDDEIDITVTDTGEGIAPEHLPHVFERFYRGDAARSRDNSGSGIGLTISKAIIDAHQGTIKAASPGPGQGSSFVVTLPRRHA
ncbi:ATP-binding protein [Arsenicicoccus piscis]|uniref:histidine kinase n=1 Tax=Arsenicicoccus piscis TaxID=673954 RepID=A0ABQ6HVC8_9MICO|nr:ATP-binding protein [Arsenicicoccus piscis]MCH8627483.1 ATP-binding protein [Arsenicicoccus piscis]GMA21653.1 two-component sensor histidine kinase [Arsenicicoccus piscis]